MKCQCCPHIETSLLICTANQLTGFYMRATLVFKGLIDLVRFITFFITDIFFSVTKPCLYALHKKSPYSELFWSAFFPNFPAVGLNRTPYLSVFSPNAGKCGPEYIHWVISFQLHFLYSVACGCLYFGTFTKMWRSINEACNFRLVVVSV